jgi:hypothetical protein
MQHALRLMAVILSVSSTVQAQKITTDFARDFDFASISTYSVSGNAADDPSGQLTDDRIRHAIIRELHRGGLSTATSSPDLRVEYRLIPTDPTEHEATPTAAAEPGPGWTGWNGTPPGGPPPTSNGALVIDAIETETGTLVWRATGAIMTTAKPEKRNKKIDKVIGKMGKRWRLILAGRGT